MTTAVQQTMACPKCGGQIVDQRFTKTKPNHPDVKCSNRACDWAIWPPKGNRAPAPRPAQPQASYQPAEFGDLPGVPMAAPQIAHAAATPQERLDKLANIQAACFKKALVLAEQASAKGYVITLDGLSALTAQLFIAFKEGR